jgi:cold shock CspA family protein
VNQFTKRAELATPLVCPLLVGESTESSEAFVMPVGKPPFNFSKPLAYPGGSDVYIKFSIVETGSLSGLDAKSKAEIKAVSDALGPVAKDALKRKFERMSAE